MSVYFKEKDLEKIFNGASSEDCQDGDAIIRSCIGRYGQPRSTSVQSVVTKASQNLGVGPNSAMAMTIRKKVETAYPITNALPIHRGFIFTFGLLDTPIASGVSALQSAFHHITNGRFSTSFSFSVRSFRGRTEVMVRSQGSLPPLPSKVFPELKLFLRNNCRGAYLNPHGESMKIKWAKCVAFQEFFRGEEPFPFQETEDRAWTIEFEPLLCTTNHTVLTFEEIISYYSMCQRQKFTYITKGVEPRNVLFFQRTNEGTKVFHTFQEKRNKMMSLDFEELKTLTCACTFKECKGSTSFLEGRPCHRIFYPLTDPESQRITWNTK